MQCDALANWFGQCVEKRAGDDPLRRQVVGQLILLVDKDESFYVREVAVHYLKELGAKDERAVRAIIRATADDFYTVRDKAHQAIKDLGHEELVK